MTQNEQKTTGGREAEPVREGGCYFDGTSDRPCRRCDICTEHYS